MQVIQIKTIEFEDLLDGVYKLEKRLDKIDEKLSGSRIKYVPLKEALKILNIQRKTADNWQVILNYPISPLCFIAPH